MSSNSRRDPQTYEVIGAAMEVHREMGPGFLEKVYQDALELEFKSRAIPYSREQSLPVFYKGDAIRTVYRADFVCFDSLLIELKAIKELTQNESAQVLHYLKATNRQRALLFNFAQPKLEYKRFIRSNTQSESKSIVSNRTLRPAT